jgi:hypothetical protein
MSFHHLKGGQGVNTASHLPRYIVDIPGDIRISAIFQHRIACISEKVAVRQVE